MSDYSIVIKDNKTGICYHLSDFERMHTNPFGWNKFKCLFKFSESQFFVANTTITRFNPEAKEEIKNETKRRTNKAKKPKKSTRKG